MKKIPIPTCSEALEVLIEMYVRNQNSKFGGSEFIACITPPSASEMTPAQRRKDKTWKAWDDARSAIVEARRRA